MSVPTAPSSYRLKREGPMLFVAIARADANNALHAPACEELVHVLDGLEADSELELAILTGVGDRAFCAGADRAGVGALGASASPDGGFGRVLERLGASKPVIAAVNGEARGEGFALALACDLVVAVESATFALDGNHAPATVRGLLRQLPLKRAMATLLAGEPISAPEGVALGFVNELASPGELLPLARRWAERVLRIGPRDVAKTRQMALHGAVEETG